MDEELLKSLNKRKVMLLRQGYSKAKIQGCMILINEVESGFLSMKEAKSKLKTEEEKYILFELGSVASAHYAMIAKIYSSISKRYIAY